MDSLQYDRGGLLVAGFLLVSQHVDSLIRQINLQGPTFDLPSDVSNQTGVVLQLWVRICRQIENVVDQRQSESALHRPQLMLAVCKQRPHEFMCRDC